MDPVPVHDFGNGKYTLTDGHSRVYVAYEHGLTHVPIAYDKDEIMRSHNLLSQTSERERILIQEKEPGLFLYGASEDLKTLYFETEFGEIHTRKI